MKMDLKRRSKGSVEMYEKILQMLKDRRYIYIVKVSELTEIIEEIEREQKQNDIIIA